MSEINIRVRNIELGLEEPESSLKARVADAIGVEVGALRGLRVARKSLDARRRGRKRRMTWVYQVDVVLAEGAGGTRLAAARKSGRVGQSPEVGQFEVPEIDANRRSARVVVVGSGPAGLYAALVLARNGVCVTLIDRGAEIMERGRDLMSFRRTRVVNPESNLLFGEGGAGTYSDGKLYTRVDHPLEIPCLEELVACGAQPEILYDARAHIGTDRLHKILPIFREGLESLGVRFAWRTRMDSLVLEEGPPKRVVAIATNEGEIPCDALFLAPGHSARETIRELHRQGVVVEAKPFQLGVRIEHPQELITRGRFGEGRQAALLGAASYNLVSKAGAGVASAHSFCMCPGGRIVASVETPGLLCTNGMSNSMHSSPWATAALVTTFGPAEYGEGPFAGVEFQEALETRFFESGGGDYTAPGQRAEDFLAGRLSRDLPKTSYGFGVRPERIDELIPERARSAIARGLEVFERRIPGFSGPDGLFVGLESRSSSPLRLPRDGESYVADGFANLYPCGEGAGHAGGIMSAAIDGAKVAKAYLETG